MLLLNRTLLRLAKGLWGWIWAIVALKLAALVGITWFAGTVGSFLGQLVTLEVTADQVRAAVLGAAGASLFTLGADLLIGEAEFRCTAKARTGLRRGIFGKVLELEAGKIEAIGPVSAITASCEGVENMQIYYSRYLPGLIYSFVAPIYLFLRLRSVCQPVAVVLFLVSFLLMPVNNLFRKKIDQLKTTHWSSMEGLTGYYLENLQGLTTFKLYNQDGARSAVLREKAEDFNRTTMAMMKVNFLSFLFTDGTIYATVAAAVLMTLAQLKSGGLDLSQALVVLLMAFGYFGSVRQLMNITHSALSSVAAADKVEKLLDMDTSVAYHPEKAAVSDFEGIQAEHVSFSYPGQGEVLHDVSLSIPKGSCVALAGLSGCGKSTLAALMMRFFDPKEGRLLLDGKPYDSMTLAQLHRQVILVPQSVSIFSGTIQDNLRLAAPAATDEEMLAALGDVKLLDWVRAQPDGLDTDVGDAGARLSGGQRQKIGIARALLLQAETILFDESTSAVDPESEQEIWDCILHLRRKRTLILISHRLSTIQTADSIIVLENGSIREQGTHEELMAKPGLYAALVEQQNALEGGAA